MKKFSFIYHTNNDLIARKIGYDLGERRKIEVAFSEVCEAQNKGDEKLEQKALIKLDNAVFDTLKLKKNERQQVYKGLDALRRMRLRRKEANVLVETAEKWKPHKKPRKRRELV